MTGVAERAAAVRARQAAGRSASPAPVYPEPLPPADLNPLASAMSAAAAEPPRAPVDLLRARLLGMRDQVLQRLLECGTPEPGYLRLVADIGATLAALDEAAAAGVRGVAR